MKTKIIFQIANNIFCLLVGLFCCSLCICPVSDLKAHLSVHTRLHNQPTHLYYFVLKRCINNGIQMPRSIDFNVPFFALAYADWVEYERTSCANIPCMDCINKMMYRNMTEKSKMQAMKRGEYRGYIQKGSGQRVYLK